MGLKNFFGFVEILRRGPDYVRPGAPPRLRWVALDKWGDKRLVRDSTLFKGGRRGFQAAVGSGSGSYDKSGKLYPEYASIRHHLYGISKLSHYKDLVFFEDWNPHKGGSIVAGVRWIRKNLGPKPGPGWQLHVLKTKKHPHGFFGPGGIVWRHKMDRHDQDLLDLIHEWPKKKLRQFVQNEIHPLLKAA